VADLSSRYRRRAGRILAHHDRARSRVHAEAASCDGDRDRGLRFLAGRDHRRVGLSWTARPFRLAVRVRGWRHLADWYRIRPGRVAAGVDPVSGGDGWPRGTGGAVSLA